MEKNKDQKIFEYFLDEHNLTLLQSDIDAIVNLVNKELDKELCDTYMKLNATNSANAGYQELNKNLKAENELLKEQLLNKSETEQALQSALEENKVQKMALEAAIKENGKLEKLKEKKETEILNLHSAMDAMDEDFNCAILEIQDANKKITQLNEQVTQATIDFKTKLHLETVNHKMALAEKFEAQKQAEKYKSTLEEIKNYVLDNTDFDKSDSIQTRTAGYDILHKIYEVLK